MTRALLIAITSAGLMLAGANLIQSAQSGHDAIVGLIASLCGAACLVALIWLCTGDRRR